MAGRPRTRKDLRRADSDDTVSTTDGDNQSLRSEAVSGNRPSAQVVTLWIHDDNFSKEEVLVDENLFGEPIAPNSLLEVVALRLPSDVRDFQSKTHGEPNTTRNGRAFGGQDTSPDQPLNSLDLDSKTRCLCIANAAPADLRAKHSTLQLSLTSSTAAAFGFRTRTQVLVSLADVKQNTATHVELSFRDAYLARSDMWRLASSELTGKTVYVGQKVQFLSTIRATVKHIHVHGRNVPTALFSGTTVPIFRSEAARFVLFIQMSREMWDFDSEGNGEILFNRVINGFLPDLFRRWSEVDVKHLVSIVMFGRLEYGRHEVEALDANGILSLRPPDSSSKVPHRDFYRVVVTDMASAQWTTILAELKKDFRIFLRDVCLQPVGLNETFEFESSPRPKTKITGNLSSALKGNMLEAINIAASQFANDYVDRDLVRTGISVVVVTPGTGVFEVDRDLLNLTSENLTNNGIGIDIVCLSRMPLHSAPLLKYRRLTPKDEMIPKGVQSVSQSPGTARYSFAHQPPRSQLQISVPSSLRSSGTRSVSRFASSLVSEDPENWCYGIPEWIDLSYWAPENEMSPRLAESQIRGKENGALERTKKRFIPRVRMYELQMMGLMELGLADIAIPYMIESHRRRNRRQRRVRPKSLSDRTSAGKSLTHPPSFSRREPANTSRTPKRSDGLLSSNTKQQGDVYDQMSGYDQQLFSLPTAYSPKVDSQSASKKPSLASSLLIEKQRGPREDEMSSTTQFVKDVKSTDPPKSKNTTVDSKNDDDIKVSPRALGSSRISRTISLAFKGFAPAPRAVASTEINSENASAQPLQLKPPKLQRNLPSSDSTRSTQTHQSKLALESGVSGEIEFDASSASTQHDNASRPISINMPGRKVNGRTIRSELASVKRPESHRRENSPETDGVERQGLSSSGSDDDHDDISTRGSVPKTMLPFIRNVNASNPIKRNPNAASLYGRWQHLYPRKPKAATVKWRSLCTPASVPLTTDEFPGIDALDTEYDMTTYHISQEHPNELLEAPRSRESLLQEMLSLRLAHGYQLVVRSDLQAIPNTKICSSSTFFAPSRLDQDSDTIYLSMGNTIQRLTYDDAAHVQVTKFVLKAKTDMPFPRSINYGPYIRTILGENYANRAMQLTGFAEEYPWQLVDGYLAGRKKGLNEAVEKLRFWRARFVLIPVDPPASAYKLAPWMNDENEEEIHLRGIRVLTQMWQKHRYIPPEERKFKPTVGGRRDPNPLEVDFRTLNPSEVVATELDKLLTNEDFGELSSTQLLPDSEMMERVTSTLPKIAQAMQGDKGIEIKDRRWHLRLHYNCFRGEDFINWLLQNFKDIESRDDAFEFGTELMEHGLFSHVNSKHAFKDGHFFYSIEPEHRARRGDSRQSWFPTSRRSERSIPPTPISEENATRDSPFRVRSHSGSTAASDGAAEKSANQARGSGEKKRVTISLSKMLRLDVDHRNRSSRLEVINLHYDRLHNPENCYHLELSWLNVTSKLVEDAIVSWASQSEKYGLKLVEVPIAEASSISNYEPFRAPYRISFVTPPPKKPSVNNTFFSATSFAPQATPPSTNGSNHIYHKALLKRFNFVLDLEAASEFPDDVDILYSWGKLEYQYTQFVHRSGVVLAQITDDGDFLLLANRLYNTRYAAAKETTAKLDALKKEQNRLSAMMQPSSTQPAGIQMQASGILAPNQHLTSSPAPSPMVGPKVSASADVLGSRPALLSSNLHALTTPEAIKDELESFCHNPTKLDSFYREITATLSARKSSSTSSSVMRPFRPAGPDADTGIPDIKLPDSLVARQGPNVLRKVSPHDGVVAVEHPSWRTTSAGDRSRADGERPRRPSRPAPSVDDA